MSGIMRQDIVIPYHYDTGKKNVFGQPYSTLGTLGGEGELPAE
jgi:hypothetical protein